MALRAVHLSHVVAAPLGLHHAAGKHVVSMGNYLRATNDRALMDIAVSIERERVFCSNALASGRHRISMVSITQSRRGDDADASQKKAHTNTA